MTHVRVELLYVDGCPSSAAFAPRLRELLAHAGDPGWRCRRRSQYPQHAGEGGQADRLQRAIDPYLSLDP